MLGLLLFDEGGSFHEIHCNDASFLECNSSFPPTPCVSFFLHSPPPPSPFFSFFFFSFFAGGGGGMGGGGGAGGREVMLLKKKKGQKFPVPEIGAEMKSILIDLFPPKRCHVKFEISE